MTERQLELRRMEAVYVDRAEITNDEIDDLLFATDSLQGKREDPTKAVPKTPVKSESRTPRETPIKKRRLALASGPVKVIPSLPSPPTHSPESPPPSDADEEWCMSQMSQSQKHTSFEDAEKVSPKTSLDKEEKPKRKKMQERKRSVAIVDSSSSSSDSDVEIVDGDASEARRMEAIRKTAEKLR